MSPSKKSVGQSATEKRIAENLENIRRTSRRPVKRGAVRNGYIKLSPQSLNILENPHEVLEWDDEELRAGVRRRASGSLGKPPTVIPRVLYDELIRRTIDECLETMRDAMPEMILALTRIATDQRFDAKDRIKAIELCMNRVLGPPTQSISVNEKDGGMAPWQKAIEVAIINGKDVNDDNRPAK